MSDLYQRLMSHVSPEPNSGCWIWTGAVAKATTKGNGGHGRVNINGKNSSAHRAMYELVKGKIPDNLTLDHLCRVRCCINPDHLEAVTIQENIKRGRAGAMNREKLFCKNGHPFNAANTAPRLGGRRCRQCAREAMARYRAKP